MRIVQPLTLTVLHGPFEHGGKTRLVVVIGAMASFDGSSVDQTQTLWRHLTDAPGASFGLDEMKPKTRGEALVSGYAFAPGGKPATAVSAKWSIGPIQKEVWAAGDRAWKGGAPSDPVPFSRMPITWDRAFGGEGFAPNPLGKGASSVKTPLGEVHPLPNIEIAGKLITSPRERPSPVGFAPIDPASPVRMKKLGTYDKRWLDTRYPEFAEDFDPTYFNTAPEDQWIEGYWEGGEPFAFENMHPDKPRIEGRLPSFAARCLVTRKGREGAFEDVALRADTVWFLPHVERVILLYRGVIEVADDLASDVSDIVAALEHAGKPKPIEHYASVRAKRLDRERGALFALRDADLGPEGIGSPRSDAVSEMESLLATEHLFEQSQRRFAQRELDASRERLRALGVDPDRHLPKTIPDAPKEVPKEDLGAAVASMSDEADRMMKEAAGKRDEAMRDLRARFEAQGMDFDQAVERAKASSGGPPTMSAASELSRLKEVREKIRAAGLNIPPSLQHLDDPRFYEKLTKAERGLKDAYRRSAHYAPPARPLTADEAARLRREVESAIAKGEGLSGRDLTGADLSMMDLSGQDLSTVMLERASLKGAKLRGATLDNAVLARADLSGADLHGAKARGANMGEASLAGAVLTGADLTEAIFIKADLSGADLTASTLDRAELSEAKLDKTVMARVEAKGLTVLKSVWRGLDLRGAALVDCNFLEVDLSSSDLSGAKLTGTVLLDAVAEGAVLRGANLQNLRVVRVDKEPNLKRCNLRGADLSGANLRGVNLEGADLSDTDLRNADLSGACLAGATLDGARAVQARFIQADLTGASLMRADLMYALLGGAVVRGARFDEASVFRADAAKMKGDDKTSFAGAYVEGIRVIPERRERRG